MSDFGVYVHIPFCRERCDYCAFATYTDRDHLMERYVEACIADLGRHHEAATWPVATSVFFGGGTPSRLRPESLCQILAAISRTDDAEVTVECNPEDADAEHLETYRVGGVNRVSFGLQSTQTHVLAGLGRRHVPDAAAKIATAVANAGFATWNLDLMFGGAGETDDDWRRTLEEVLALPTPPPHVSAYALTVEPGTPLARVAARHPDDDTLAQRYEMTDEILTSAGYQWEEISNWARPGHECRHNHLYWNQGDYLGIGSAAHSHRDGKRWWNIRTPERYIDAIDRDQSPMAGSEVLSDGQRSFEARSLSLRTRAGVHANDITSIDALEDLVERRGDRVVLTVRGRLLANEVTTRLVSTTNQ